MTYSEVVDTALSYADRVDSDIQARMQMFLAVVESRVNRLIRTRNQSKRAYIVTALDKEYYGMPADFAGLRDIELRPTQDSPIRITLQFVAPEVMNNRAGHPDSDPCYTIINNQLQIWPKQDGQILEIIYYQRVPPLTSVNPTNWLSELNPDVYLFGALTEISSFVKDADAAILWDKRFLAAIDDIIMEDAIDRWSGPTPIVRLV
jgi:hypothetical protein